MESIGFPIDQCRSWCGCSKLPGRLRSRWWRSGGHHPSNCKRSAFEMQQLTNRLSFTLQLLIGILASTMFILVYSSDINKDCTYHDVLLSMCGKRSQQLSAISILLTCFGICVTFLIIIGDQYDRSKKRRTNKNSDLYSIRLHANPILIHDLFIFQFSLPC